MSQMIKGNTGELTSPSPLVGEGRGEGVSLLKNARKLRADMTDVEKKLWTQLRAKRFIGYKFKRQVPMQKYIADFACYQPKLIIELDGGQHADQSAYDRIRDQFFVSQGFTVLHFWNNEVNENMDGVLQTIFDTLMKIPPLPNPLPQGERELRGSHG